MAAAGTRLTAAGLAGQVLDALAQLEDLERSLITRLEEVRAERAQLEAVRSAIDAAKLSSLPPPSTPAVAEVEEPQEPSPSPRRARSLTKSEELDAKLDRAAAQPMPGTSMRYRVLELLAGGRELRPADLVEELGMDQHDAAQLLCDLYTAGRCERVSRGLYRRKGR